MHKNRLLPLHRYQEILKERKFNIAMFLSDKETGEMVLFRPAMKSLWLNDYVYNYTRERTQKLYDHFKKYRSRMITLTYDTKLYSQEEVAERHKADIKKFVRLMRAKHKNFQYCYFIELTKKNYVHFHIYVSEYYHWSTIKECWLKASGSTGIKVKEIKNFKQMSYCSRYHNIIRKFQPYQLEFAWKHISRLFGQSRHFFDKPEEIEKKFEFMGMIKFSEYNILRHIEEAKKTNCLILDSSTIDQFFQDSLIYFLFNPDNNTYYEKIYDIAVLAQENRWKTPFNTFVEQKLFPDL